MSVRELLAFLFKVNKNNIKVDRGENDGTEREIGRIIEALFLNRREDYKWKGQH